MSEDSKVLTETSTGSDKNLVIAPPKVSSSSPDSDTKTYDSFVAGGAPNQVLRIRLWGIEYGTDDKGNAASIILSMLLLFCLLILFSIGAFVDRPWIDEALKSIFIAFTFTAGVAIGKSSSSDKKDD